MHFKIQVSSSSGEEKSSSDGDEDEGGKSTKARQKRRPVSLQNWKIASNYIPNTIADIKKL